MKSISFISILFLSIAGVYSYTIPSILKPFHEQRALKIISGIANFDSESVEKISIASEASGATHLDIACDPTLVRIAKQNAPSVGLMVSSVVPERFVDCVEAGADMLEIGNFDACYEEGLEFNSLDVIDLVTRTQELCPNVPLSVTIPHKLSLEEQIGLAQSLEELNVDIIQTEGSTSVENLSPGLMGIFEKATPTLASSYAISRSVKIPVMCSSGINTHTAKLAMASGASGIGVGSAINKLSKTEEMKQKISELAEIVGVPKRNVIPSKTQDFVNA
jgi:hypothetical protein